MLDFIIFIGRINYRYYSHEQLNQVMNVKPNLDRKELMKRISQNKVDKVVVFYKDRATRTC